MQIIEIRRAKTVRYQLRIVSDPALPPITAAPNPDTPQFANFPPGGEQSQHGC